MAEIINLRRARKARVRAKAESEAAAHRARHGRTKGEKLLRDTEEAKITRLLDGAKRDPD